MLSGNRNFEGRVNHDVRANYLASPPLVVAYALAGSIMVDLATDPLGTGAEGEPVYLKDIWPSSKQIAKVVRKAVKRSMFKKRYGDVFRGDPEWRKIEVKGGLTYGWDARSTYVQNPPYFTDMAVAPAPVKDIEDARILGLLLDSITTDHISPAGSIKRDSPAGHYLTQHGVALHDFNSYGSRRGNHEVMMRGTFANIRIKNMMVPGVEGGVTVHYPSRERMAIYDAAMRYTDEGVPLVVFAGKEYGTGSSRDWAAKGTRLLGVRAVIAESFERIHRSNLIGMGVLPLLFAEGMSWKTLELMGDETVSLRGLDALKPMQWLEADVSYPSGETRAVPLRAAIDTFDELDYYRNGGILHYVLRPLPRPPAGAHPAGEERFGGAGPPNEVVTSLELNSSDISVGFRHCTPHEAPPSVTRGSLRGARGQHLRPRHRLCRATAIVCARPRRGRAVHEPRLLVVPRGRRAVAAARRATGPARAFVLGRLLGLSRLARHARQRRQ